MNGCCVEDPIMGAMIDAIYKRSSVRNYADRPVEKEKQDEIRRFLKTKTQGPFGNRVRFELVNLAEAGDQEVKKLGTYGFIKGASLYIVPAIHNHPKAVIDLGYCFETIILHCTDMGLGTCWLGGTFTRANFAQQVNAQEDEICPAISPVGYAHEKKTLRERALRSVAKSDRRKPWEDLFFKVDLNTSLNREEAGAYDIPLECVRLGPSATNNQPWRIVRNKTDDTFHLFLKRTRGYDKMIRSVDLQLIDMGIAMCHFELSARETGLQGGWKELDVSIDAGDAAYIASWEGG